MIKIRQEIAKDYAEVYQLVKKAFESAEHTDGDEHNLVERLRTSNAFIPELSIVVEEVGQIVGHIMLTKLKVNDTVQLALAPVSVLPDKQKCGIGGMLINEAHKVAKLMGYEFSILLGHPTYYPRFGYLKASDFGIKAPFEVPDECFMAVNLQGKDMLLNGVVEYPQEFFAEE